MKSSKKRRKKLKKIVQPAADSSNVFSESGREIECFTMFLFVVERRERETELEREKGR